MELGLDMVFSSLPDLISCRHLDRVWLYAPYIPLVSLVATTLLSSLTDAALHVWDTTDFFFSFFFDEPLLPAATAGDGEEDDGQLDLTQAYQEIMIALEAHASATVFRAAAGHGGERPVCAVCIGNVDDGEVVREVSTCGHVFHRACLDRWVRIKLPLPTCPLCRRRLLPEDEEDAAKAAAPQSRLVQDEYRYEEEQEAAETGLVLSLFCVPHCEPY